MPRTKPGRNQVKAMPVSTSAAPISKTAVTAGRARALCRYLNGSAAMMPVSGLLARPSIVSTCARNATKSRAKGTPSMSILRRSRARRVSSPSRLFTIYIAPNTRARNITAKPSTQFHGFASASKPCQQFAQRLMTGEKSVPGSAPMALLSTVNAAPLKNVPTAMPMSSGASSPLTASTRRHDFWLSQAPCLAWNS